MLDTLPAFLPVAAVLTLTPGVATALVVRSAVRGGRREALLVTAGNSLGVLAWAVFAAVGVAAVVAASAELFTTIKLAGAVVLVVLGVQGLLARKTDAPPPPPGTALRVGLVTSLANPKLAVFFVALFPQFIPDGRGGAAERAGDGGDDRRPRPRSGTPRWPGSWPARGARSSRARGCGGSSG